MNNITPLDIDGFLHDVGEPEYHSIQTIELGELIDAGVFTWERIDWLDSAYDADQYGRVCEAFELRFWLREIGITPVGAWMKRLSYMLNFELMPKYKPLYESLADGFDPLQSGGEYRKERRMESDFPETLLSGTTQDYLSSGYDFEREVIGRGNMVDDFANYVEKFKSIDVIILDEIERELFTSLYSTNVNGW